jgi:hypothetical protein
MWKLHACRTGQGRFCNQNWSGPGKPACGAGLHSDFRARNQANAAGVVSAHLSAVSPAVGFERGNWLLLTARQLRDGGVRGERHIRYS